MESGALQQLLKLYRPLLLKLAHKHIKGALRAKVGPSDIVQTTVWKVTQNFAEQQFDKRSNFLAWLVTILQNEALDASRRFRRAKKRDLSLERPLFSPETQKWLQRLSASLTASGPAAAGHPDHIEQLLAALRRLPAHYQLVLRLRYFERLKFDDIGIKLDRTSDAARVLHNRALKKLRDELVRAAKGDSSNS